MTTCEEFGKRLDDHLDGLLSDERAAALEAHAAGCEPCRVALEGMRSLMQEMSDLPDSVPPARNLWGGIEERLVSARWPAWPVWSPLAATIILLAGIGIGFLWRGPGAPRSTPPPERSGPASRTVGRAGAAERAFDDAVRELRAALRERRGSLSPRTLQAVDEDLRLIEQAVDEIETALARDPGNRELERMLVAAQLREVDVLQRITQTAALR